MNQEWMRALWGGMLIGVAVSLMLLWKGRVAGVSGIIYGLVNPKRGDSFWRWMFVFGLVSGGFTLSFITGLRASEVSQNFSWTVPVAGLLVGFGTVLGSGCTSGHGVCGVSRLSPRSILATVLFILAGVISVALARFAGVIP